MSKRSMIVASVGFFVAYLCLPLIIEVNSSANAATTYEKNKTFMMDYSRNITDSIKAGHYDWVNGHITIHPFPPAKNSIEKKELSCKLFHFNKSMKSNDIISQMDKDGYRPANFQELLAFGETNPEFQIKFPIVGLGSFWINDNGDYHVARLGRVISGRCLCSDWYGSNWNGDYRFLGIHK